MDLVDSSGSMKTADHIQKNTSSMAIEQNASSTNDIMSVSYQIVSTYESDATTDCPVTVKQDMDDEKVTRDNQRQVKHYTVISYGPINVRKSHRTTPTLQSGRRSKFIPLEGEAAIQREIKREKNRRTAEMLKERQINIERQLVNELQQLETQEKDLVDQINNLKSYKRFLEERCQQQILVAKEMIRSSLLKPSQGERNVLMQKECKSEPVEPRSPSPNWQLLFTI